MEGKAEEWQPEAGGRDVQALSRSRLSLLPPRPAACSGEARPGQTGRSAHPLPLARPLSHVRAPRRRLPPRLSHPFPSRGPPIRALLALLLSQHWSAKTSCSLARSDPPGERTDRAPLITLKIAAQVASRVQCRHRRELEGSVETPAELPGRPTSTILCPPVLKAEAARVASGPVSCFWRPGC